MFRKGDRVKIISHAWDDMYEKVCSYGKLGTVKEEKYRYDSDRILVTMDIATHYGYADAAFEATDLELIETMVDPEISLDEIHAFIGLVNGG